MPLLKHDTKVAVEFLQKWSPEGPWVLTAIIPDGLTETVTFTADKWTDAAAWIEGHQGIKNLYFHVNPVRKQLFNKASKEDIARLAWLHIDIDPRAGEDFEEERRRALKLLQEFKLKPTVIIDSGGGYQGFWKLREQEALVIDGVVQKAQELEAYNIQLEKEFQADHCHNVDRIMRLPGTVNIPTAKKVKKGRVKTIAKLIEWNDDVIYPIDVFTPAPIQSKFVSNKSKINITGSVASFGTEELREWAEKHGKRINDSTLARIATGEDPINPSKYPSRSEALFAVCCELVRAEVDDDVIFGVITDPNNKISESVLDKKNWKKYASDQIQRACENAVIKLESPKWDRTTKEGNPLSSYWNARTALLLMGVECRYDKFRDRHIVGSHELQEFAGEFSDHAERILRDEIIRKFGFDPGDVNTCKAALSLCTENRFDSLIDHLNALPAWDKKSRLDTWLIDYLGTDDSPYTREAGAAWLTAAIVRAFEPGAKFDYMLVLMGGQGVGKSTALRILAGDSLFSDASFLHARDAREVLEVTAGVWILECAELDGMSKKDVSTLKATIARQSDTGRPAYARSAITIPRRFILAGTTNEQRFLQDPTENRRFWPIAVGSVDLNGLKTMRDQLFAEALARYKSGNYKLTLGDVATAGAKLAQAERRVVDEGYMELLEGIDAEIQKWKGCWVVKTEAVYDRLGISPKDRNGQVPRKIKEAMAALGWRPEGPVRISGELCRLYVWTGNDAPGSQGPF